MSDRADDGGQAFPGEGYYGLSRRDYFAAAALVVAADKLMTVSERAALAYAIADAMLRESQS